MNSDFEAIFELKLEVQNLRRPVWRRVQVPSTQTFWDLHCAIQNLMGFDFDTAFAFHVHNSEGHLKTFAIDEKVGYFTPDPQVAWLFRIADYFSLDGNRRMEYLHDAVFAPWVCSIELQSVLAREAGVRYPRCTAGKRAVFESRAGMLGFMEAVETGTDLPRGFDPEFFDPAGVKFDDSKEEQMWTTFLESVLASQLAIEVIRRAQTGVDSGGRHLVPMPAPYYDLLLKQNLLPPEALRDYNPAEPLNLVPVWFSQASLRKLADAIEAQKSHGLDRVTARRLAAIAKYIYYLGEGLERSRRTQAGSRKKRTRNSKSAAATQRVPGFVDPDPSCPSTLAAGIWRSEGKYQPVIICRRKESGDHRFVAVKMPLVEREQPINAAQIAQLDLLQAAAELEPPQTDMAARLFAIKIGYGIMPLIDMRDVAPADAVLHCEAKMDEMIREVRPDVEKNIREGDPPIVRETFDRLIRGGHSAEDATNMICMALVIEFIRRPREEPNPESIERALSRLPNFPDDP